MLAHVGFRYLDADSGFVSGGTAFDSSRRQSAGARDRADGEGAARLTLEERVRELLDHDRTHGLELEELAGELRAKA